MAAGVGVRRHWQAIARGLPDAYGCDALGWSEHIEGACGELVVAKALNLHWSGSVGTFKNADLGLWLQVRTRSKPEYELIIRPDDAEDENYVLVTGKCPRYEIRGWISGRDGKREEWLKGHGGRYFAHFVPHSALHPIDHLRVVIKYERPDGGDWRR